MKEKNEKLSENEEGKQSGEVSRRSFLVGAGAVVAGTVIGGGLLAGCEGETVTTTKTEVVTTSKTATTTIEVPTTVFSTVTTTKTEGGTSGGTKTVTTTIEGETGEVTESDLYSFMIPPEPPSASKVINTVTADIVILGGGNSGFMAATGAAEEGVSVVVVEKQTEDAYCTWTQDFGSFNSNFAKSKGVPEYDTIEIANEFMRNALNRSNWKLLKQYVEKSGETVDWILEKAPAELTEGCFIYMGPPNDLFTSTFPDGRIQTYKNYFGCVSFFTKFEKVNGVWNERGRTWDAVMHAINEYSKSLGAEFYFGLTGEQLIQDDTGRVTGLYAYDADGNYTKFIANKAVILCGGDYMSNNDMIGAYMPETNQAWRNGWTKRPGGGSMKMGPYTVPPCMGEGVQMAMWAGGMHMLGPQGGLSSRGGSLAFGGSFPKFDANGKRFCNEFKASGSQAARLKPGMSVQICDNKWAEYCRLMPTDHGAGSDTVDVAWEYVKEQMAAIPLGDPVGGYVSWTGGAEIGPETDSTRSANTWGANTLSELADLLGYSGDAKATFLAEVEHYNELCAAGKDTDFGKDYRLMWAIDEPPFYGAKGDSTGRAAGASFGIGGVMVDEYFRVVDKNHDPIPGLYAAGNNAGDRYGCGDYYSATSGNYQGFACTTGRLAGQYAATL